MFTTSWRSWDVCGSASCCTPAGPAEPLKAFSGYFPCDVHINQWQLDELYAVLHGVKTGEISAQHALKRLERARHRVWAVAALYASDGGGIDGARVVAERGDAVSGSTVATAASGGRA